MRKRVALAVLGLLAVLATFAILIASLSERPVGCECASGEVRERWASGWQRDDGRVCARACGPGNGGTPVARRHSAAPQA